MDVVRKMEAVETSKDAPVSLQTVVIANCGEVKAAKKDGKKKDEADKTSEKAGKAKSKSKKQSRGGWAPA